MEESHTTIVAFKANGLAVLIADGQSTVSPLETVVTLDSNKTVRLNANVHFATAGSSWCRVSLAQLLLSENIQAFGSGVEAAEYLRDYINARFLDMWGSRSITIVLVSNIDGPRIFTIGRVAGEGNYTMNEVNEDVIARGKGADTIFPLIQAFPQNMNAKDSFNYAYKCIRQATLMDHGTGGDITMIRIYPTHSHTTVFYQDDPTNCTNPYVIRMDYRNADDGFPETFDLASYPAMIDLDFPLPGHDQHVPGNDQHVPGHDQQVPGQNHP